MKTFVERVEDVRAEGVNAVVRIDYNMGVRSGDTAHYYTDIDHSNMIFKHKQVVEERNVALAALKEAQTLAAAKKVVEGEGWPQCCECGAIVNTIADTHLVHPSVKVNDIWCFDCAKKQMVVEDVGMVCVPREPDHATLMKFTDGLSGGDLELFCKLCLPAIDVYKAMLSAAAESGGG